MLGRVKQEPAHYRVEEREKRTQRGDTGDYVVKNRQKLQVFSILVHRRKASRSATFVLVLEPADCADYEEDDLSTM
jgi:hypothetical protein